MAEETKTYTIPELIELFSQQALELSNNLTWLTKTIKEQNVTIEQSEPPKKDIKELKESASEKEDRVLTQETFFNQMGREMSIKEYLEFKELVEAKKIYGIFDYIALLPDYKEK